MNYRELLKTITDFEIEHAVEQLQELKEFDPSIFEIPSLHLHFDHFLV